MGAGTFFSKLASYDPLAQALDLPGAHKYAQQQARDAASQSPYSVGPYTGVAPSLAGANAGYMAGGPGSIQGISNVPNASNGSNMMNATSATNATNPYARAAGGAARPQPWTPNGQTSPYQGF